jgi:hypothetical protein
LPWVIQFQPLGDLGAELVALGGDPLHVDGRRRQILVPERVLRLDDAPRGFGRDSREGFEMDVSSQELLKSGATCFFDWHEVC